MNELILGVALAEVVINMPMPKTRLEREAWREMLFRYSDTMRYRG